MPTPLAHQPTNNTTTDTNRVAAVDVRFRAAWDRQMEARGPKRASLFAACASAVAPLFLSALPFKLINDASQFVGPTVLNRLLTVVAAKAAAGAGGGNAAAAAMAAAVNGTLPTASSHVHQQQQLLLQDLSTGLPDWADAALQNGYCLAVMLFAGTLLGVLADNQHFQRVQRAGFRLRSIMTAEVYRKVSYIPLLNAGKDRAAAEVGNQVKLEV
jgi:hypothetical protein